MLNVLFVCHGNICRSPMAEFIFKKMVKDAGKEGEYYIESAAVSAEDLGSPIYPPAKRCLTSHGIPFDSSKCARLVTRADYDRFDRIIIMDSQNRRWLSRIIPDDPLGKVQRCRRSLVHWRFRSLLQRYHRRLQGVSGTTKKSLMIQRLFVYSTIFAGLACEPGACGRPLPVESGIW